MVDIATVQATMFSTQPKGEAAKPAHMLQAYCPVVIEEEDSLKTAVAEALQNHVGPAVAAVDLE